MVVWQKTQPDIVSFIDGGKGHELKKAGDFQKLEKARKQIFT